MTRATTHDGDTPDPRSEPTHDAQTESGVEMNQDRHETDGVSRRQALKILGSVPVGAALGVSGVGAVAAITAPIQAQTRQASTQAAAPKFFTAHEWRTVRLLVDYIIPRDERSGSATDAKVPEYIDFLLAEPGANENTKVAMRGGLGWLDAECRKRSGKTFADATDAGRRAVLDDIAYPEKATPEMRYGVAFFNRMRDMTASGFFSSVMGWKDLQYTGGVANPGYDGCPQPVLDRLSVSYELMKSRVRPEAEG